MDLVSRRISPRGRLVLGMVLKLFTVVIAAVLFDIGLYMHDHADGTVGPTLDLLVGELTEKKVMLALPIGMALIMFHSLVHAATDADYLIRNKLPPERARSGH
jgi:TRAP-type C4-dicarboxylate transport system permease small subunit